MTHPRAASPLLFLTLAALPAGCSREPADVEQVLQGIVLEGAAAFENALPLEMDGVRLDVDETLYFELSMNNDSAVATLEALKVDGLEVGLEDGVLTVGEHRFDGLKKGDAVRLSKKGIAVNGEERWDWPAQ